MTIISSIIIVAVIVTAVLILIFVKPNPNRVSSKNNALSNMVDRHNRLIKQYNQLNNECMAEIQKLELKIMLCNDVEAQSQMEQVLKSFSMEREVAIDYMNRSNTCLDNRDIAGSSYCLDNMVETLESMNRIIRSLDKITPKNNMYQDAYQSDTNMQKTSTVQFFNGCYTKEAADARYKSLAKAFHPDSKGGDTEMFRMMQDEYNNLRWD